MEIATYLLEALANLTSAKLRSFLAILGILVGTASVVAMVSSGQLATQHALEQFKKLGTDLLSVSFYQDYHENNQPQPQPFELGQIRELQQAVPQLTIVAPYITLYKTIGYQGQEVESNIIATTADLQEVIKLHMQQGRFLTPLDNYEYFCIIGHKLFNQLQTLGLTQVLGARLAVGNEIFSIIGVLEEWPENSFLNSDINQAIIIPIHTAKLLSQHAEISNLVIRFNKDANIDELQNAITQFMQKISPAIKLFFRSPKQIINSMASQQRTFTLLLGLIGSISLIVGGIGVMNIMLVSVTERRREIGIRKAIGADKAAIRMLFLAEAVILTLFGGLLGVLAGIITSFVVAHFTHWHFHLFLLPPAIGFIVSVAVGIFFGFYPAHKAAKLDPIETLRAE